MIPGLRIVIADDDSEIREGFCRLLSKLGCDVVGVAVNGKDLVEICLIANPDLVITDIRMPKLSGIEAARKIANKQSTPVIIVSSYECPADQDFSWVSDFLLKPVSLSKLQDAIAKALPAAKFR